MIISETLERHIAFVLRCSLTAAISYKLALSFGLSHPAWAAISGLIVSQEKLNDTRSATLWRLAGTLTGIAVAVAAGSLLGAFSVGITTQIACVVGLCAMLVRCWPALKVSMWTVPIVYLSHSPDVSLLQNGLARGAEVLIGGLVGAALHWLAEIIIARLERGRPQDG